MLVTVIKQFHNLEKFHFIFTQSQQMTMNIQYTKVRWTPSTTLDMYTVVQTKAGLCAKQVTSHTQLLAKNPN